MAWKDAGRKPGDDGKMDRSMFGTDVPKDKRKGRDNRDKDIVREKPEPLKQAENAWKARTPTAKGEITMLPRLHEMQRTVNGFLNKVCPENVGTIIDKVAGTEVKNVDELELVISLIFKKALAEPHYCETYADMVFELKKRMPEFPSDEEDGKKVTFKTVLLNACQNEFEALPKILKLTAEEVEDADLEEIEFLKKKKKERVLANMKFIGQLFLRQLLSAKIIGSVIQDLTNCEQAEVLPEEPMIECICELLTNIGFTLEATPVGKAALTSVMGRLLDLKNRLTANGKGLYSKRIQFQITDVLDMRKAGWVRKTHKATAKTKEEIKREQNREFQAAASGKTVPSGEVLLAGARPAYLGSSGKK